MLHWRPWKNRPTPVLPIAPALVAVPTAAPVTTPLAATQPIELLPSMSLDALPPLYAMSPVRQRERIRATFGPSQPVENREHLLGREREIARLFDVTMNLRSHALVYGARGAGKTSLVRAFGDYADEQGMLVIYLSCGAGGSFASIFRPYLDFLPPSAFPRGEEADVRAAIAALPADFDARALAAILSRIDGSDVIFIIDEFDRVDGAAIRGEIASLVKLLSDLRAPVMLVFVGIARNVHELIDGHASLRRHLVAVPVPRFEQAHVACFFDRGEAASGLAFPEDVRKLIGSIAAGSPYHLRLFSMHAAFAAMRVGAETLTQPLVVAGLHTAFQNWASVNPGTAAAFERYAAGGDDARRRLVALALVALDQDRFTVAGVRAQLDADAIPGDADDMLHRLRDTLVAADGPGAMQFDDPLAPQFLLLSCCLAARDGEPARDEPPLSPQAQTRERDHVLGLR